MDQALVTRNSDVQFDLIVIGSGPGGYVCAIRAAQLGLKVACVEKRATLGGTCLNIGCIPSKALLQSSENFHQATHTLQDHGILVGNVRFDLARMQARKGEVVTANTKGVEFLFKKNKITWLKGAAKFNSATEIDVAGTTYTAKNFVIATGSDSVPLKGVEVDEKRIVTSTGALELNAVPKHLVVIGAGVIGLELGSVWRRLGAEVTVIEFLDRITPTMDIEIAGALQKTLTKQGLKFKLGAKVTGSKLTETGVTLTVEPAKGGASEMVEADIVLLAIGRYAYTAGLGLDAAGVETDERGRVKTDAHYATNIPHIFAIGDVITGPMLAHKAEDEGVAIAERLAGQAGHVNYDAIPSVVYTWPEVASVGHTEEELKAAGIAYTAGKFPFTANGRARAMGETDGFVKILADKTTDRLLGAHIIGPDAGTLIAELTTAIEFGASAEDVARICHAHPTLSEAVKEAALAADGRRSISNPMSNLIRLGVNIDHVATLRNARGGPHPDPFTVAQACVAAGADGITIHLREDRRHIRDADAELICAGIPAPINLEMAATDEMACIACALKPHGVCIVPERRTEITTEGGLDVIANRAQLTPIIARLNAAGIIVSLFVDPRAGQLEAAAAVGAGVVELHTGAYANHRPGELAQLTNAAALTTQLGLECHAGHGLTYANVQPIAALPQIRELNIGHYLIGEALLVGLPASIRHMKNLMAQARQ